MYSQRRQLSSPTVLGIDERIERVLCYSLLWVSGLILLFVETRNTTVRRHAWQSVIVFGTLGVIGLALGLFGGPLGAIPLIGPVFGLIFGVVNGALWLVTVGAWLLLMVLAFFSPATYVRGPRRSFL